MKQILAFGDSNTWGYNPENGERFGWGVRWTSILQERLQEEQIHVIEEGLCGRTTVFADELRPGRKGSEALPLLLESHTPLNLVIIMLGTNDCKSIYHTNEYIIGKGIENIIQIVKTVQPQAEILLVSPIFLGEEVWKTAYDIEFDQDSVEVSKKLRNVYEKIAKSHQIHFLGAADYAECSVADMEHMDAENHKKLANAIEKKIRAII